MIGVGLLIMLARMADVSVGTLRVISVVDGRMKMAFWLRFLKDVMKVLKPMQEDIFYTVDYGGSSNQILLPISAQPTNPRRFFKRK